MEHHGYLFDMDDAKNHVMTLYCYRRRHAPRKKEPCGRRNVIWSQYAGRADHDQPSPFCHHSLRAQTPEQLLELTQEYIRPLIGMIDELNEAGAEDELRVIRQQLTRLVFRAQPLPRAASSPKNRSARHRAAVSPS